MHTDTCTQTHAHRHTDTDTQTQTHTQTHTTCRHHTNYLPCRTGDNLDPSIASRTNLNRSYIIRVLTRTHSNLHKVSSHVTHQLIHMIAGIFLGGKESFCPPGNDLPPEIDLNDKLTQQLRSTVS